MSVTVVPLQISSLIVTPLRVGLAPGPSDHGALAGLGDDDHPQYLNAARGDARYAALAHAHVVTELEPYAPEEAYGFEVPLLGLTGFAAGTPGFTLCGSSHAVANGPPGEENYTNHVVSWGWNVKAPSVQDIAGKPGLCLTLESRYYNGAAFMSEFQFRGIKPNGEQFRPFGLDLPHSGENSVAHWRVQECSFNKDTTNESVVRINAKAAEGASDGVVKIHIPSPTVNGSLAVDIQFPEQASGSQTGFRVVGDTSWNADAQVLNFGTGSANFSIGVVAASQPAFAHFFRSGGQEWGCGKNAADNFEIAAGAPGSNTALTIDKTTRQAAFVAPPRLPSYAVAALPSAATMGAGALAYVADASGGPSLACSDGSAWRVVAALGAVVS